MPRGNGGIIGPVNTSFSGVWSLTEAQLRRSANTWPNFYAALLSESATGSDVFSGADAADPYFEYTTLLLPGNGTNGAQNNTFQDSSANNFTITRSGNTTQGTFSPFSQTGWGNYFDGTTDYLDAGSNAALGFGTGDFTVEAWIYRSVSGSFPIYTNGPTSSGSFTFYIISDKVQADYYAGTSLTGATTVSVNTWNHVAVVRSGSTLSLYLNGNRDATTTTSSNNTSSNGMVGRDWTNGANYTNGYISNLRVVKGTAVYSGTSFTPPTSPLTAITNTSLLTCQSNRFIDNSTNNFTITRNGDTKVVAFSPFNPAASWSAATYGGSGYFDGSADYLSVAYNSNLQLGSSDFTIEFWFYGTVAQGNADVFLSGYTSGTNLNYLISVPAGNDLKFYASTTGNSWAISALTIGTLITSQWNHIAITRSGSTVTTYLNGTVGGTSNALGASAIYANTAPVYIGAAGDNPTGFNPTGYFSGVRIVIGTAITPPSGGPTSPPTAVTNTSLLLNFTNAGIFDATSKNDLETVGNAQISTTQSKWGGSSMSFDGTGDSCDIAVSSPFVSDWSGNFTIELWAYTNNLSAQHIIFANVGTNSSGYNSAYINTNGSIAIGRAGINEIASASSTWTSGQWNHLAFVRNGVNLNIYYNGSSVASTSSASTYLNSTVVGLAIGKNFQTTPAYFNGYIQDLRITKGYARYTSNFTPPTAAFPTL